MRHPPNFSQSKSPTPRSAGGGRLIAAFLTIYLGLAFDKASSQSQYVFSTSSSFRISLSIPMGGEIARHYAFSMVFADSLLSAGRQCSTSIFGTSFPDLSFMFSNTGDRSSNAECVRLAHSILSTHELSRDQFNASVAKSKASYISSTQGFHPDFIPKDTMPFSAKIRLIGSVAWTMARTVYREDASLGPFLFETLDYLQSSDANYHNFGRWLQQQREAGFSVEGYDRDILSLSGVPFAEVSSRDVPVAGRANGKNASISRGFKVISPTISGLSGGVIWFRCASIGSCVSTTIRSLCGVDKQRFWTFTTPPAAEMIICRPFAIAGMQRWAVAWITDEHALSTLMAKIEADKAILYSFADVDEIVAMRFVNKTQ